MSSDPLEELRRQLEEHHRILALREKEREFEVGELETEFAENGSTEDKGLELPSLPMR